MSGVRHCQGGDEALNGLRVGDKLIVVPQPENDFNPLALRLHDGHDRHIGWIPDWIVDFVHPFLDQGMLEVRIVQIDLLAPDHLKVLSSILGKQA